MPEPIGIRASMILLPAGGAGYDGFDIGNVWHSVTCERAFCRDRNLLQIDIPGPTPGPAFAERGQRMSQGAEP